MPRPLRCAALVALLALPGAALAAHGPEGVWSAGGGAAKIRIAPCAGKAEQLCGTIVSVKPRRPEKAGAAVEPASNAPAPKSPVGQTIMAGFKPAGANKWSGKFQFGQGKSLNANLSMNKDGTLRVNACILAICKGQDWTRAS